MLPSKCSRNFAWGLQSQTSTSAPGNGTNLTQHQSTKLEESAGVIQWAFYTEKDRSNSTNMLSGINCTRWRVEDLIGDIGYDNKGCECKGIMGMVRRVQVEEPEQTTTSGWATGVNCEEWDGIGASSWSRVRKWIWARDRVHFFIPLSNLNSQHECQVELVHAIYIPSGGLSSWGSLLMLWEREFTGQVVWIGTDDSMNFLAVSDKLSCVEWSEKINDHLGRGYMCFLPACNVNVM